MGCNAGTHHGSTFWINLDPCGLLCGMMTWVLLGFGMYVTTSCVIHPWLGDTLHAYFHTVIFNAICVMAAYSHWRAMTTDPGAVPKGAKPLPTDIEELDLELSGGGDRVMRYRKFCKRCMAFKPSRAHHCSMCNRCIVKMDHHCPWVNNCVGVGNHKLFLLFIFWINVVSCYALVLIIAKHLTCSMWRRHGGCQSSPRSFLLTIFLVIEAVLFGLFTLCMCADQLPSITTNETQIDRLKNQKHEIQTEINEVFGTPGNVTFALSWLVPAPTIFPESCRHLVFGYCVDSNTTSDDPYDMDSELVPLNTTLGSQEEPVDQLLPRADGAPLTSHLLQAYNSVKIPGVAPGHIASNKNDERPSSPSSTSSQNGTVRKRTNV